MMTFLPFEFGCNQTSGKKSMSEFNENYSQNNFDVIAITKIA